MGRVGTWFYSARQLKEAQSINFVSVERSVHVIRNEAEQHFNSPCTQICRFYCQSAAIS